MPTKRSFSHWSPQYVRDRLIYMLYEKTLGSAAPWLTIEANLLLSRLLSPNDIGVEWGSGRSTRWFAKHIRHITSVEHDLTWGEKVRTMITPDIADKVTLVVCPDVGDDPRTSRYVRVLDSFRSQELNFALVDGGLARDICALEVLPKLAPGGLLVLDNAQWFLDHPSKSVGRRTNLGHANDNWREFSERVSSWRCIWTTTALSDTAIWVCP